LGDQFALLQAPCSRPDAPPQRPLRRPAPGIRQRNGLPCASRNKRLPSDRTKAVSLGTVGRPCG